MSIPLWAHAYDNYILTAGAKNSKKKTVTSQGASQQKQSHDSRRDALSSDPKIAIKAFKTIQNASVSTGKRRKRRKPPKKYQSIIVLPVEEMSEEDLQYVLEFSNILDVPETLKFLTTFRKAIGSHVALETHQDLAYDQKPKKQSCKNM